MGMEDIDGLAGRSVLLRRRALHDEDVKRNENCSKKCSNSLKSSAMQF